MTYLRFDEHRIELREGESVLEALLREGFAVPYGCRSGVCQTCLMRAAQGIPPQSAQKGLKDTLAVRHHFLACICHPQTDLDIMLANDWPAPIKARIRARRKLARDILELTLETDSHLDYHAGQFIEIRGPEEHRRCYSLASVTGEDNLIELHVRRIPGGRVSNWLHDHLTPGDNLEIRGPMGSCFYCPGNPQQTLLMIGTGTGLAPLYGILREALRQGHYGPIHLFHGSRSPEGLYFQDVLQELADRHAQLHYVPCLSGENIPGGITRGRAHEVALSRFDTLSKWRIFLCGNPGMVREARLRAFLAGAESRNIHADPFMTNTP